MYSTGLWLTNGSLVTGWAAAIPGPCSPCAGCCSRWPCRRRLGAGHSDHAGRPAAVLGQPLAQLWRPGMYGQVLVPLAITLIISLFNHGRSFFLQWREAAVRAERLEKETAVARLD